MSSIRRKKKKSDGPILIESWLFKMGTKLFISLLIIAVFLTLVRCTVKKPEAPEWNTTLTVPLIDRTYSMEELVQRINQDGVTVVGNDVVFSFQRDLDTFAINSSEFNTSDLNVAVSDFLGSIDIDPPIVSPVVVDASSIGPLSAAMPGVVPPTSFQVQNDLPDMTSFTSATISSGAVYIVVNNQLGFDLDYVNITISDRSDGSTVSSQIFPGGIPDGTSDSVIVSLNGATISNQLRVTVDAHTPGGTVLTASDKKITTGLNFPGSITATSATAELPETTRNFTQSVELAETDAVYQANLASGELELIVNNGSGVTANMAISVPDLKHSSGLPLAVVQAIAANSVDTVLVDVSSYILEPSDSTVPQQLAIDVDITIPATAPNHVTVDQNDQYQISATLRNLSFESISGVFSSRSIDISPTVEQIDVPEGFDSLQLVNAVLAIKIDNSVELSGTLDVLISGDNGKSINISGTVNPATGGSSVITTIIDSTVANLLQPIPSTITVSGQANFGDGVTPGLIELIDFVAGSVSITAPLEVIIGNAVIDANISSETIDTADIDAITDHAVEARFIYNVINHLPVGASASLYFGPDSATLYSAPQLLIDDLQIVAAPTTGGIASDTASTGFLTVALTNEDIRILENDTLYFGTQLRLDNTGGQAVRLTASDYLHVQGRVELEYHFDGEF